MSGTPKLSEAARHVILPAGIVDTDWPRVRDTCARAGIEFDLWQDGIGRAMFARRADGMYAADTVVLSIPRQVGKTYLLGAVIFALCQLHPGMLVLWTAHHGTTTRETFRSMQSMARMPKVAASVLQVWRGANDPGIEFVNGSRIKFGAREHGFGRGLAGVDALVFDEAQILGESALDDLIATTNQASTGNPLILMAGTPPQPKDAGKSEVFTNRRSEALAAGSGNAETLYVEFSADDDADFTDRAQWSKANPSYPRRTSARAILRMLKHLGAGSFRREALGIWDASARVSPAIDVDAWGALVGPPPADTSVAYGVKFSPDGARMALVVAAGTDDGAFVEAVAQFTGSTSAGLTGLASWLADRWRDCDAITIDGKGAAGALTELLLDAGVSHRKIVRPTFEQVVTANTALVEAVRERTVTHSGQPGMAHSVATSTRKDSGTTGGWTFVPIGTDGNPTPVQAAALALAGLGGQRNKQGRRRGQPGRAVFA